MLVSQLGYINRCLSRMLSTKQALVEFPYVKAFYEKYKETKPTLTECQIGIDYLDASNCLPQTIIVFADSYTEVPQKELTIPDRVITYTQRTYLANSIPTKIDEPTVATKDDGYEIK